MTTENTPASHIPPAVPEFITSNFPAHTLGERFEYAVHTAIQSIPRKRRIVKPECMDGYKITQVAVSTGEATFHVHDESAWTEPTAETVLPWSAPSGKVVALVSTEGFVTIL